MILFDFAPTPLFGLGVAATATSIWLYAKPALQAAAAAQREQRLMAAEDDHDGADEEDSRAPLMHQQGR